MKTYEKKPIEQMDIGELELEYISNVKARAGGIIMMILTVPFIWLCWVFNFMPGYWFFGVCFLIWSAFTFSFHSVVLACRERLNEELGE